MLEDQICRYTCLAEGKYTVLEYIQAADVWLGVTRAGRYLQMVVSCLVLLQGCRFHMSQNGLAGPTSVVSCQKQAKFRLTKAKEVQPPQNKKDKLWRDSKSAKLKHGPQ